MIHTRVLRYDAGRPLRVSKKACRRKALPLLKYRGVSCSGTTGYKKCQLGHSRSCPLLAATSQSLTLEPKQQNHTPALPKEADDEQEPRDHHQMLSGFSSARRQGNRSLSRTPRQARQHQARGLPASPTGKNQIGRGRGRFNLPETRACLVRQTWLSSRGPRQVYPQPIECRAVRM